MQSVKELINKKTQLLKKCNIENPKANAINIIANAVGCTSSELVLRYEQKPTRKQYKKIKRHTKLRCKGKPFQYIIKQVEFLNLHLKVNKNVLIPRNETEILADMLVNHINKRMLKLEDELTENKVAPSNSQSKKTAKNHLQQKPKNYNVLDLCCGSGAIGLSIAKNTNANVVLSDISAKALKVSKHNSAKNKTKVSFVKSDLFKNISKKFNLIVSNPPYIKSKDINNLQTEVKSFEPHLALDGGESGYDFYEKIIKQAPNYLLNGGELFLEIGVGQSTKIESLLKENNFQNIKKIRDYSNIIRFISASLPTEKQR